MKPLLRAYLQAFKEKDFDFITKKGDTFHAKQHEALNVLTDNQTVEFVFGGSAGGSKSWTGASWLTFSALTYPDTNWFVGRDALIDLRDSTMLTFSKVFRAYGITPEDVKYNGQDHYYQFSNGSTIRLLSLQYLPSDPLYERYGSKEFTGGWIEEAGQVHHGAFDILKTRVGRCLNDKYGLLRKVFLTCNPKKNFLYTEFYLPSLENKLKPYQKFLPCLVTENPFIEKDYIEALKSTSDESARQRLLFGNWDYETNPNALIDSAAIIDFLRGTNDLLDTPNRYITADIAMQGSDLFVVIVWSGWTVIDMLYMPKCDSNDIEQVLMSKATEHGVPMTNICFDSDGIGNFLRGKFKNAVSFNNGAAPILTPDEAKQNVEMERKGIKRQIPYANLKAQCSYHLAKQFQNKWIKLLKSVKIDAEKEKDIIQELGMVQSWKIDDERRLFVMPKDEIKKVIGRSPDFADAFIMRSIFDLIPTKSIYNQIKW